MDERTASCFCVERAINFNFLTVDVPFADKTVQIRRPCNMVAFRTEKPGFSRSFEPSFFFHRFLFVSVLFFFRQRKNTAEFFGEIENTTERRDENRKRKSKIEQNLEQRFRNGQTYTV